MQINPNVFREYDIRGKVGRDLTGPFVRELGRALGTYFHRRGALRIALGRDCRLSSPGFRDGLADGLVETGREVVDLGMVPTPLVYFAAFTLDVHGAVQITGSHNPPDENGFKVCLGTETLYGSEIQQVREIMEAGRFAEGKGAVTMQSVVPEYLRRVAEGISPGGIPRKVVVDCGNGTAGPVAPALYRSLGADVTELFGEPDGRFPHHHPDPTIPDNLRVLTRTVLDLEADLGIAYDGDADRIGVVDDLGQILWGDRLLVLFAREILGERPGATVIGEVKCSQVLFDDVARRGGTPIMWRAGHSLIKAKMRETGAVLAGELSGHICFADRYYGYDDAIYAGARILEILTRKRGRLSGMLRDLPHTASTPEIRVACPDESKFRVVDRVAEAFRGEFEVVEVDGARILFSDGWGLVRASNTQPVIVMRFEAENSGALRRIRGKVEERLETILEDSGGSPDPQG